MVRTSKPKAGSRAFWPRKRARRIYPKMRAVSERKEAKPLIFAGYKAGMTQVSFIESRKGVKHGQHIVKPVTILEVPSLVVAGFKTYSKDAYGLKESGCFLAEKLDKNLKRKTSVPKKNSGKKASENVFDVRLLVHTQPKSAFGKKKPELFEVDLSGSVEAKLKYAQEKLGQEIKVEDAFKEGEYIDVKAVTTGKGFQGPVKRYGIVIRSRKNTGKKRHVGSLGPYHPARVLPGKIPYAGQHGFQTRTELNKRIIQIGSGNVTPKGGFLHYGVVNGPYLLVEGSVPAPKKRLVMFRKALRTPIEEPVKVDSILLNSQQGLA